MNEYETKLHNQYLEPEEEKSFGEIGKDTTFTPGTSISTLMANL